VEIYPNGNMVGVRNHKIMEKKEREKISDQKEGLVVAPSL
jgi:hypothetical protein